MQLQGGEQRSHQPLGARVQNHWCYTIIGGWCLLLTGLLYGSALGLPFFFDDLVHLPYLDANSLADIWLSAGQLAYYRPLAFTIWKALFLIGNEHSPLVHHGLNLLLHALNGWLVASLAMRRQDTQPLWRGGLAATIFIVFPFSYQAIPWAGALTQILPTTLVLLALFAYERWNGSGSRTWLWVSLLCTLLAPFAHENGALVGIFVGIFELTRRSWPGWRQLIVRSVIWTIPALIWLPWRLLVETGRSQPILLIVPETLLQNSSYFIQGLGLPLSWLGGWLDARAPINDITTAFLLSGAAIGLSAWLAWNGDSRHWLRALLWYIAAILPAALFLSFAYVIDGPRLMMLAAAGSAWLWSDTVVSLWTVRATKLLPRALAVAIAVAILLPSIIFVGQRQTLHNMLGETYKQLVAEVQTTEDETDSLLLVNFPAWLAPERQTFAVGHEGVLFWPPYAFTDNLLTLNGAPARDLNLIRNEAISSNQPYLYGAAGTGYQLGDLFSGQTKVLVAEYDPNVITILPVGQVPVIEMSQGESLIAPGGANEGEASLNVDLHQVAENLTVTLTWTMVRALPADTTVFVHVVDADGVLLAQIDGDPLLGFLPLGAWAVGVSGTDIRQVIAPPGAVAVRVGLYRRGDGLRFLGPAGADYLQFVIP